MGLSIDLNLMSMAFNIVYEPKEELDHVAIDHKDICCAKILAPKAGGIGQNHRIEED